MQSENKNTLIVILLCSVSFVIVSYLVFRTALPKLPNIFLYNLIIVFSMHELGYQRTLFFLAAGIFLSILISITAHFLYVLNIPVFFITFLIADDEIKKHNYHSLIVKTRIEEILENINVLKAEHNKHKREAASLEKKNGRYNSLKDIVSTLNSTLSLEDVMKKIMDNAFSIVGKSDSGLLFLVDTSKQELNLAFSINKAYPDKVKTKKGDMLDEWVFKERQALLVEDIKKDFRFSEDRYSEYERLFRSVISCPLMEGHKVIGILRLENLHPYHYTSEDLRLLDIICDIGAVSLQNATLYKQTLDLAIKDGLTGLYLRRYFLDRLKQELLHCYSNNLPCSFLMIDVDNFKNYNDEYGHMAGDMVLKLISKVLLNFISGGMACRYGGEEFSILLPDVSKKDAIRIADNIRKAVKKEDVELRRVKTHVTVSIGVAAFPDDVKTYEELIMKADERLYKAKREGKDRVITE
ncbi:MAG: sensor domain-containing diguanylate cyclase [Candidatus Omnitrophota bacterium]|nr:sensor domain-containing diguanylate cyclase [Candidatus Omnitrophota bacterium]